MIAQENNNTPAPTCTALVCTQPWFTEAAPPALCNTGSYVQSTWGKLKHLGEYCTTDNMRGMRASACMVEHAVHDAHGTPEAHAAAAEAAARARELRAGLLGPEHPLTMASMAAMGESVQKQITGGPGGAGVAAGEGGAKAEALLSEVLEMRKKVNY